MIKKHRNKNDYWMRDGLFVRDFTKTNCVPKDINNLYSTNEFSLLLENEINNQSKKYVIIDHESIRHLKVLIISDGVDFENFHKEFYKLPKDVVIFATNGALKKWKLVGKNCEEEKKRAINYYVVNNPYEECMWFLPTEHSYYPKCIASNKTNPKFLLKYQGIKYSYFSTEGEYSGLNSLGYKKFDDYRNPICGCISLAYSFGAQKIAIVGHDDSFNKEKPGSIKLENGLYCYPQQLKSDAFIDGMCYWLTKQNIKTVYNSFGSKLNNSEYIELEGLVNFFED